MVAGDVHAHLAVPVRLLLAVVRVGVGEMKLQLDIRVGCVAVYRGNPVNCFSDLPKGKDLLFYGRGKWDGDKWTVSKIKILMAKIVYWWNRRADSKEGV